MSPSTVPCWVGAGARLTDRRRPIRLLLEQTVPGSLVDHLVSIRADVSATHCLCHPQAHVHAVNGCSVQSSGVAGTVSSDVEARQRLVTPRGIGSRSNRVPLDFRQVEQRVGPSDSRSYGVQSLEHAQDPMQEPCRQDGRDVARSHSCVSARCCHHAFQHSCRRRTPVSLEITETLHENALADRVAQSGDVAAVAVWIVERLGERLGLEDREVAVGRLLRIVRVPVGAEDAGVPVNLDCDSSPRAHAEGTQTIVVLVHPEVQLGLVEQADELGHDVVARFHPDTDVDAVVVHDDTETFGHLLEPLRTGTARAGDDLLDLELALIRLQLPAVTARLELSHVAVGDGGHPQPLEFQSPILYDGRRGRRTQVKNRETVQFESMSATDTSKLLDSSLRFGIGVTELPIRISSELGVERSGRSQQVIPSVLRHEAVGYELATYSSGSVQVELPVREGSCATPAFGDVRFTSWNVEAIRSLFEDHHSQVRSHARDRNGSSHSCWSASDDSDVEAVFHLVLIPLVS